MNIVVTGHARHGKDTFCELLGLPYSSSTMFICERVAYPALKDKYGYRSPEECFNDRVNHRQEWFNLIVEYCKEDKARLCRELFAAGNQIYCGLRNVEELNAAKAEGLVDLVVWVDASDRLPIESVHSITITPKDCDIIINNNRSEEELKRLATLFSGMFQIIEVRKEFFDLLDNLDKMDSTCKAAAQEIEDHWEAHCDEEGYGPINLVDRLKGVRPPTMYNTDYGDTNERKKS